MPAGKQHHNDGRGSESGKSGRRGSVNNKKRLDAFSTRGDGGGADWGGCDSRLLQTVVVAITSLGGAITLGLSRNGGAHSLTLLLDDARTTLWFNGDADLDEKLREVIGTLEAL